MLPKTKQHCITHHSCQLSTHNRDCSASVCSSSLNKKTFKCQGNQWFELSYIVSTAANCPVKHQVLVYLSACRVQNIVESSFTPEVWADNARHCFGKALINHNHNHNVQVLNPMMKSLMNHKPYFLPIRWTATGMCQVSPPMSIQNTHTCYILSASCYSDVLSFYNPVYCMWIQSAKISLSLQSVWVEYEVVFSFLLGTQLTHVQV